MSSYLSLIAFLPQALQANRIDYLDRCDLRPLFLLADASDGLISLIGLQIVKLDRGPELLSHQWLKVPTAVSFVEAVGDVYMGVQSSLWLYDEGMKQFLKGNLQVCVCTFYKDLLIFIIG